MSLCNFARSPSIDSKVSIFKLNLPWQNKASPPIPASPLPSYLPITAALPLSTQDTLASLLYLENIKHAPTSHSWHGLFPSLWRLFPPSISDMLEFQISALVSIRRKASCDCISITFYPLPTFVIHFIILTLYHIFAYHLAPPIRM